jgi:hypothetical protein
MPAVYGTPDRIAFTGVKLLLTGNSRNQSVAGLAAAGPRLVQDERHRSVLADANKLKFDGLTQ